MTTFFQFSGKFASVSDADQLQHELRVQKLLVQESATKLQEDLDEQKEALAAQRDLLQTESAQLVEDSASKLQQEIEAQKKALAEQRAVLSAQSAKVDAIEQHESREEHWRRRIRDLQGRLDTVVERVHHEAGDAYMQKVLEGKLEDHRRFYEFMEETVPKIVLLSRMDMKLGKMDASAEAEAVAEASGRGQVQARATPAPASPEDESAFLSQQDAREFARQDRRRRVSSVEPYGFGSSSARPGWKELATHERFALKEWKPSKTTPETRYVRPTQRAFHTHVLDKTTEAISAYERTMREEKAQRESERLAKFAMLPRRAQLEQLAWEEERLRRHEDRLALIHGSKAKAGAQSREGSPVSDQDKNARTTSASRSGSPSPDGGASGSGSADPRERQITSARSRLEKYRQIAERPAEANKSPKLRQKQGNLRHQHAERLAAPSGQAHFDVFNQRELQKAHARAVAVQEKAKIEKHQEHSLRGPAAHELNKDRASAAATHRKLEQERHSAALDAHVSRGSQNIDRRRSDRESALRSANRASASSRPGSRAGSKVVPSMPVPGSLDSESSAAFGEGRSSAAQRSSSSRPSSIRESAAQATIARDSVAAPASSTGRLTSQRGPSARQFPSESSAQRKSVLSGAEREVVASVSVRESTIRKSAPSFVTVRSSAAELSPPIGLNSAEVMYNVSDSDDMNDNDNANDNDLNLLRMSKGVSSSPSKKRASTGATSKKAKKSTAERLNDLIDAPVTMMRVPSRRASQYDEGDEMDSFNHLQLAADAAVAHENEQQMLDLVERVDFVQIPEMGAGRPTGFSGRVSQEDGSVFLVDDGDTQEIRTSKEASDAVDEEFLTKAQKKAKKASAAAAGGNYLNTGNRFAALALSSSASSSSSYDPYEFGAVRKASERRRSSAAERNQPSFSALKAGAAEDMGSDEDYVAAVVVADAAAVEVEENENEKNSRPSAAQAWAETVRQSESGRSSAEDVFGMALLQARQEARDSMSERDEQGTSARSSARTRQSSEERRSQRASVLARQREALNKVAENVLAQAEQAVLDKERPTARLEEQTGDEDEDTNGGVAGGAAADDVEEEEEDEDHVSDLIAMRARTRERAEKTPSTSSTTVASQLQERQRQSLTNYLQSSDSGSPYKRKGPDGQSVRGPSEKPSVSLMNYMDQRAGGSGGRNKNKADHRADPDGAAPGEPGDSVTSSSSDVDGIKQTQIENENDSDNNNNPMLFNPAERFRASLSRVERDIKKRVRNDNVAVYDVKRHAGSAKLNEVSEVHKISAEREKTHQAKQDRVTERLEGGTARRASSRGASKSVSKGTSNSGGADDKSAPKLESTQMTEDMKSPKNRMTDRIQAHRDYLDHFFQDNADPATRIRRAVSTLKAQKQSKDSQRSDESTPAAQETTNLVNATSGAALNAKVISVSRGAEVAVTSEPTRDLAGTGTVSDKVRGQQEQSGVG
eukprot:g10352.t1